ncbi:hypothetical protein BOW44_13240, partial [Solemya velum gill symbiont]
MGDFLKFRKARFFFAIAALQAVSNHGLRLGAGIPLVRGMVCKAILKSSDVNSVMFAEDSKDSLQRFSKDFQSAEWSFQ